MKTHKTVGKKCTFVKPFWNVNKQDVSKFIWNSLDLSIPLFELQPKESIILISQIPSSQLHQTSLTKVISSFHDTKFILLTSSV